MAFQKVCLLSVLVGVVSTSSLSSSPVLGGGLVDHRIGADSIMSLDGTWDVTVPTPPPPSNKCNFTKNIDWKPESGNNSGHPVPAHNESQCCAECNADPSCVAAVYVPGSCWIKDQQDCAGGSYHREGRVSCQKIPGPPTPPGPPLYAFKGNVPGDIITDLQNAGMVGDPLYELNFQNSSLWNTNIFYYTKTFTITQEELDNLKAAGATKVLVFDGIKMGAKAMVNNHMLGQMDDQFLRYDYAIPTDVLLVGANTVTVVFDPSIDCEGRWMACTGGWDWAPYSGTSQDGINTFSRGIWKSVYIAEVSSAALMHVVPQVMYAGDYPTTPLQDGTHGGFDVDVRVLMYTPASTQGTLEVSGSWASSATASKDVTLTGNLTTTLSLKASAQDMKLWWPNGLGSQPLYNITVKYTPQNGKPIVSVRRIGFRMFALVTGNDTDPDYVKKNKDTDGTDSLGMLWRVNGAVVLSRGANMIPMEELEGRMSAAAHTQLVQNAVDANMNTLRVWGGGMFLPDAWYDACDQLGIMVYHDMQYAQGGHSPKNSTTQDRELRHAIRRLSHHPAIVLWDGCNECRVIIGTHTGIYATFVMTVVAEEDKSRAIWPSCPALGWTGGVNRLTALPNGKKLTTPPNGQSIETHGPYQHGTGFAAVNGAAKLELFPSNIPITLKSEPIGPGFHNIFASEFGSSVYSSFESMSPTLEPKHWGIHAGMKPDNCSGGFASKCKGPNPMSQRNYPCDNIIDVYFNASNFDLVGEDVFKKQLWQCMVGQALLIKQNIETRRSSNQFGIIVWQFNEIWPTGGWGSIEYGTVGYTKGQVLGGRWKPLQYWYKQSIYADVMATCGTGGACYVKNDGTTPFKGTVNITAVNFATGAVREMKAMEVSMAAGAGVMETFSIGSVDGSAEIIMSKVTRDDGTVESNHAVPYVPPGGMKLKPAKVTVEVASKANPDGSVDVTVTTDAVAVYVTLTTLAQGRFDDNAFVMLPGSRTIKFLPVMGFKMEELTSTVRVEHVASYQDTF